MLLTLTQSSLPAQGAEERQPLLAESAFARPRSEFLVTWSNGPGDPARGEALQKQALCTWEQATSLFLETQPRAFGREHRE